MDRRQFLKGVGLASVAGVAAAAAGVAAGSARPGVSGAPSAAAGREIVLGTKRLRIDGGSTVYVSTDDGATWTAHARFDDRLSIRSIAKHRRGARLHVALGDRRFRLALARSGRTWLTA